jgi:hypothetical protein
MASHQVREALANWIGQALSPAGNLPEGTDRAEWVADRFAAWWRPQVQDSLEAADAALSAVREELMRLGGWQKFGEALHELIHAGDALSDLRARLRIDVQGERQDAPRSAASQL